MHGRGYSLVEMVVVIGIVSALIAVGTLKFLDFNRGCQKEAQTRLIYAELLKARATALFERRSVRVKLFTDRFEVYSSAANNGAAPVELHALRFPIIWNRSDNTIEFDSRGLTTDWGTLCLAGGDGQGAVDSVVINALRVSIGRKDKGNDCSSDNITFR